MCLVNDQDHHYSTIYASIQGFTKLCVAYNFGNDLKITATVRLVFLIVPNTVYLAATYYTLRNYYIM